MSVNAGGLRTSVDAWLQVHSNYPGAIRQANQSAQRAEGRLVSVIAASNRGASASKPDVGPFHRSCSTSSKSTMSVLSVSSEPAEQERTFALAGERVREGTRVRCVHVPLAPVRWNGFEMAKCGENRCGRLRPPSLVGPDSHRPRRRQAQGSQGSNGDRSDLSRKKISPTS